MIPGFESGPMPRLLCETWSMSLHPRLAQDCHELGQASTGLLLLHRNASVPWFILVPDTDAMALYLLPKSQRQEIEDEWNALAAWVFQRYDCERVNVAAIGNLVPQLHLHIVGRRADDPCWPGVVWGQELPSAEWSTLAIEGIHSELERVGLFRC